MKYIVRTVVFIADPCVFGAAWTSYNVNPAITSADETQWQNRGWCIQSPSKLDKLPYKGGEYEFQLAQGVWMSPAPVAAAIKYFLEEQLNVKVNLLGGNSSQGILQEIANCSDFTLCENGENDIESFPPPAWAAAEVWTSAATENFIATRYTDVLGTVGYRTYPGMYMYRRTYDSAIGNNFTIRWYENLKYPQALQYFTKLSELDAKLRNITACDTCAPGCIPGDAYIDGGFFSSYQSDCDSRGWWIAPACRNDPEKCIPVVLWVPYWNAKEMAAAAVQNVLPLAITWLWFVGAGIRAIPEFSSDPQVNFLFYWWGTDRTFGQQMSGNNSPVLVNFAQEQRPKLLEIDQVQLPDIVVWKHLQRVDEVVYDAWKKIRFPQDTIDLMLDDLANGKSPPNIACAWMLGTNGSQVWNAWMPDLSDCRAGLHYDQKSESARDKCRFCSPGKFTGDRGFTECSQCPPGKYQSEAARNHCLDCQPGYYSIYGFENCERCPKGEYQDERGQGECKKCDDVLRGSISGQASFSVAACVCPVGTYRSDADGACNDCAAFQTTDGEGASSPSACYFGLEFYVVVFVPISCLILLVSGCVVVQVVRKTMKRIEEHRRVDKIIDCIATSRDFAFPMVLMNAKNFMQLGRLISFEEALDRQILRVFSTVKQIEYFRKRHKLIFFSHQWLAWTEPDPDLAHYNAICVGIDATLRKMQWEGENCYLWVDYHSVPQESKQLQKTAISTLPFFASLATVFVIVAPNARHSGTGLPCNFETYQRRMWCRTEVFSFYCRRGLNDLYRLEVIDSTAHLAKVDETQVDDVLLAFEGDCACCALGHVGVTMCDKELLRDVFIGLYADALWTKKVLHSGSSFVCRGTRKMHAVEEVVARIQKTKERFFPRWFEFVSKSAGKSNTARWSGSSGMRSATTTKSKDNAKTLKMELFGDLIATLETMIQDHADDVRHLFEDDDNMEDIRSSCSAHTRMSKLSGSNSSSVAIRSTTLTPTLFSSGILEHEYGAFPKLCQTSEAKIRVDNAALDRAFETVDLIREFSDIETVHTPRAMEFSM